VVISKVESGNTAADIVLAVGIFAIVHVIFQVLNDFSDCLTRERTGKIWMRLLSKLFFKTLSCDYGKLEDPEGQNLYQRARTNLGQDRCIQQIYKTFFDIVSAILCFILFSTVLSQLNFLIIFLLIGTSFANYYALIAFEKWVQKNRLRWSEADKQQNYIIKSAGEYKFGKDIRIYSMKSWLFNLRDKILKQQVKNCKERVRRSFIPDIVDILTTLLRDGIAYGYLGYVAFQGRISIAEFALYFGAVNGLSAFVTNTIKNYYKLVSQSIALSNVRQYLDMPDPVESDNPCSLDEISNIPEIRFVDVYFKYGNSDRWVLENLSFTIKKGEKIALVGINGAGKTTIVKLICGFYTPTSGTILIDGVNIERFKKNDLFTLMSAVFQDISIFPFTIGENVSMKKLEETDLTLLDKCLKLSGLYDYVQKLEKGIETPLTRSIEENGHILSGGQQQKLLLARSIYKTCPILILDEPTAALDPIAESELYEKYMQLSQDRTVIYISHRLASTRFCERIFFLQDGNIAENGSHEELMRNKGRYAEMFEIQSHYYQKNIDVMEI
jgi:ABC-type multidrug transport system fused ATPase/permease subunit